ncbi:MAG: 50S ribosomal protein L13 [Phycisphaerales bacterium]
MRRETSMHKFGEASKKWKHFDATGQSLGRLASEIAVVLMGKHKPDYTPHIDCGDFVVITNAKQVVLTGKKADQKLYRWYTGYPSGLKHRTYGQVRESKPDLLIENAVKRMLPKNRLGRVMLSNLKVYAGADHPHAQHKPETLKV